MILPANLVSRRQEVKGDDLTCILGQSQTRGDGWWSYLHTWSVINKRWWVLPAYLVSHRHEVMGHDLTCMLGQSGPCRRTSVTTAGWWTPVPVVYPGPGSHPAHSPRCTQHQYSVLNYHGTLHTTPVWCIMEHCTQHQYNVSWNTAHNTSTMYHGTLHTTPVQCI